MVRVTYPFAVGGGERGDIKLGVENWGENEEEEGGWGGGGAEKKCE